MYNSEFQNYLSKKTNIELSVIKRLFEKETDVFKIALILTEKYDVDEKFLGKIWGDYLGFAYVNPNSSIVNKEYARMLGEDFIKENSVLPLYKFGKAITVVTSDPQNPYIQDKIEKKLSEIVSFVFCFPFDIEIYLGFNNINQE